MKNIKFGDLVVMKCNLVTSYNGKQVEIKKGDLLYISSVTYKDNAMYIISVEYPMICILASLVELVQTNDEGNSIIFSVINVFN